MLADVNSTATGLGITNLSSSMYKNLATPPREGCITIMVNCCMFHCCYGYIVNLVIS